MTEARRHITNPFFPWPPTDEPEPEDEEEDPKYYCPHGVEVPWSGGACDLCADEDAYDHPWQDADSWGFISDDE